MFTLLKASDLLNKLHEAGGFTADIQNLETPTTGYMVSLQGCEAIHNITRITEFTLLHYARRYQQQLASPGAYFGGWIDGDTVYLDVSVNVSDLEDALNLARDNDQLAIYDLGSGESVYLAAYNLAAAAIE